MPIKISEKIQDWWWKLQCSKNGTMVQVFMQVIWLYTILLLKNSLFLHYETNFFFPFSFCFGFFYVQPDHTLKQIQNRSTKWKNEKTKFVFSYSKKREQNLKHSTGHFFQNCTYFGFESIVNWSGGSTSKCILNDDVFQKLGVSVFPLSRNFLDVWHHFELFEISELNFSAVDYYLSKYTYLYSLTWFFKIKIWPKIYQAKKKQLTTMSTSGKLCASNFYFEKSC